MKTIFFLLPTGITVRNFLFTGVLEKLIDRDDLRVIAITRVPEALNHNHGMNGRLFSERFPNPQYSFPKFLHAILRRRFYKINETRSMKILSKGPLSPHLHEGILEAFLSQPLPRSKRIYQWLCSLEQRFNGVSSLVQQLFHSYHPSLVISTHPTAMDEYEFLKHSRKIGVPSIGIVKTWDNLTTKGYIPSPPDYYLVWNKIMKEEIKLLHQASEDRIGITGIPQFDPYADRAGVTPREGFLRKMNLDPNKKTILYATSPEWINREDPEILQCLVRTFNQDRESSIQTLARLHPLDSLERYRGIVLPNLAFQVPGAEMGNAGDERMMDPRFITEFRDTLFHSDIVINTCSTTSVDAVAMDKPVVNIAFDLEQRGYYKSCRRYYDFDHFQPILKSGATSTADSFEKFVSMIRRYLENPELESLERSQLRETICYKVDGLSGQRVASNIHRILDDTSHGVFKSKANKVFKDTLSDNRDIEEINEPNPAPSPSIPAIPKG